MTIEQYLKDSGDNPEKYRLMWTQVNGEITRADLERKTWWGGWRFVGSLLSPLGKCDAKIKELEQKLKAAKDERANTLEQVKLVAITYVGHNRLYGKLEGGLKGSVTPEEDLIKSVKGAGGDKPADKPTPIMSGQLKAVSSSGGNSNNTQRNKGNNQNH